VALPKAQIIILRQDGNKTIQCMHNGMSSNLNDCGTQSDWYPYVFVGTISAITLTKDGEKELQIIPDEIVKTEPTNPLPACVGDAGDSGNADDKLTARMRRLLDFLWQEWKHLQLQIESWVRTSRRSPAAMNLAFACKKSPEWVHSWPRLLYPPSATANRPYIKQLSQWRSWIPPARW
jgi:hypothetical protein